MKKITTLIYTLTLLNFVSFTAHAQTYCTSRGTNTTHGYIKEVQLSGGISNISGNNGGYADFTAQSATLFIGSTNNIALTPGFISGAAFFEYWTVYIDYNHDGIFEPSEIVAQKNNAITAKKAFTVPATALLGATRMRIQMQAGAYETNPCATFTYGEVEDYTVNIKGSLARLAETNSDIKKISTENNTDLRLYPNPAKDNLTVAQTYCTSRGTNTTHGYIKEVQLSGGISNISGNNGGYADFTAQSATLFIGSTNNIKLTPGWISEAATIVDWTVYIDYNHDGIFEPSEIVGEKRGGITVTKSFTAPATALLGRTRMRIQMQEGIQETDPCATYTYGEVEDYTVDIKGSLARLAETNSDIKKISTENNTDLRLYPNPVKDNLTVEYKSSGNGNVKVNVYNLSGQKVINIENPSVKGLTIYNLNTSKLGSGFYIFEMENNGQRQHQKFLISR